MNSSHLFDGLADLIRQRTAVADAGHASIADGLEAERVEVLGNAARLQILGDNARARTEARLDERLYFEAGGASFAGKEAYREEKHTDIGADFGQLLFEQRKHDTINWACVTLQDTERKCDSPAPNMTEGLLVFVHEVMAAIRVDLRKST